MVRGLKGTKNTRACFEKKDFNQRGMEKRDTPFIILRGAAGRGRLGAYLYDETKRRNYHDERNARTRVYEGEKTLRRNSQERAVKDTNL